MNEPEKINTGNAELDYQLIAIRSTFEREASARLEQAWRIGRIDECKLYLEGGFGSISECFRECFGADISDKTIKALSRIGRTCLEWKDGKVRSIIAHDVIQDGKPAVIDYSYTVLNQILSIGSEKLIEYDASGRIWPEMTLAQAKEFMHGLKELETAAEDPSGDAPEGDPEEQINTGEYQKRLDSVKKVLNHLVKDFDIDDEDADYLIDLIEENTYYEKHVGQYLHRKVDEDD